MARLTPEEQDRATDVLIALRELASLANRSRTDVDAVALRLGCHPATVYKKLRRLGDGAGTIRILAGAKRGFPKGASRLHPRQVEIIDHLIHTFYHQSLRSQKRHGRSAINARRKAFQGRHARL
jgi:putative transposase